MLQLFIKGGPIMWPLLATSLVALTVVLERVFFILRERLRRDPAVVEKIFASVENGDPERAITIGQGSKDFVARVLTFALSHREQSHTNALLRGAGRELKRFNRGLSLLDTVITLAPLLGLLGTVTGMIRSFSLLGGEELGAPAAITGGIAEALIATAFGLLIAIIALLPFNFLNTKLEDARHEIEDAAARLDALLKPADSFGK
ncbi:MAG TPA: MotA/TolQ/ExbB proton channel family protein [Chthoniobacteraceae bacterium]|jgi:biopolymer transport protein ExbB|nr:MotA/TolQ/ExbB proton channel family protein [Chthoniobacteraceae bacterium]